MIRRIATAGMLGALNARGSLYARHEPALRSAIAGWSWQPAETVVATEEQPICTNMTAMGTDADWVQLDPDFAAGKRALVAGNWTGAIAARELAVLRDPRNADIQNYIGYAHRRLRQWGPAMRHYQEALMFNPRHRGAREHLGELYLALGEPDKAQEQLAALKDICLIACDEQADLAGAIEAYAARRLRPAPSSQADSRRKS
jgi:tetratricopeptide (TPR) repeat protein